MRDIKFRGWTGLDMESNVMAGFLGAFYVKGIDEKDSASMSPFNSKYFKNTPLMQFTGLQDKNGVDIYEGDILEYKNDYGRHHIYKVFKTKGGLVINTHKDDFYRKHEDIHFYDACADMQTSQWIEQCEIIGNIYENTELLK